MDTKSCKVKELGNTALQHTDKVYDILVKLMCGHSINTEELFNESLKAHCAINELHNIAKGTPTPEPTHD